MLERNPDVRRRPRRHVAGAGHERDAARVGRGVAGVVEPQHIGADRARVVARGAVLLQDRLDLLRVGRALRGRRDLRQVGDLGGHLGLGWIDRGHLQAELHVVIGGDQADDRDRCHTELAELDRGRRVDLELVAGSARSRRPRHATGRRLHREISDDVDVVVATLGDRVRQPGEFGRREPGELELVRLEIVGPDACVAERRVRRELFEVDDDLADAALRRCVVVDGEVAGHAVGATDRGRRVGTEDLLADLVPRLGAGGVDPVDRLARFGVQLRCRRSGERDLGVLRVDQVADLPRDVTPDGDEGNADGGAEHRVGTQWAEEASDGVHPESVRRTVAELVGPMRESSLIRGPFLPMVMGVSGTPPR